MRTFKIKLPPLDYITTALSNCTDAVRVLYAHFSMPKVADLAVIIADGAEDEDGLDRTRTNGWLCNCLCLTGFMVVVVGLKYEQVFALFEQ